MMLSCVVLSMLAPSGASADPLVLTFDNGDYDPNMVPPGGELHGPYDWIEDNGIRAAGFWAVDVGTPGAFFQQGHTHIVPDFSGRTDGRPYAHHAYTNDVQGLIISLESGEAFNVVSIDYRLEVRVNYDDPYVQRVPWTWTPEDAQMLLSTSFDPTLADFSSQWTPFAIDDGDGPWPAWKTVQTTGFDGVTSFYLTTSATGVLIDTIVLELSGAVPEPSTGLLAALGITGVAAAGRRRR